MPFTRETESLLRQVLEALPLIGTTGVEAALSRLDQLQRGLEPETEFAMILAWLGKCRLVHKLGQEQLPLASTKLYRVPDLLAVFDYNGSPIPVLIEVKKTTPTNLQQLKTGSLSLKPHYSRYAKLLGLPILVAWKHHNFWTLFEIRHAKKSTVNSKITFQKAMTQNLLGLLAGDFSYRLAPGTRIRLRFTKLSPVDPETGGFEARIDDPHFVNPNGERIPNVSHLASLFMIWDNETEEVDEGDAVIQDFVVQDVGVAELASRTLPRIIDAFASMRRQDQVNWRSLMHNVRHFVHDCGRFRTLVEEGSKHGVFTSVINFRPRTWPTFLPPR